MQQTNIQQDLTSLRESFRTELHRILDYWSAFSVDNLHGGFHGQITEAGLVIDQAPKGAVLNARILWSFSAATNHTGSQQYLDLATRSYEYLIRHFLDPQSGGIYWSVDFTGQPLETKKQIYAQAFAIYGLSEYHRASGNLDAIIHAQTLFNDIEDHSADPLSGGYIEALTRDWQPIADLRLSDKDANEKKTMNTHLHILEAYTSLYRSWPDPVLAARIRSLLDMFCLHIVNSADHHLTLFFDEHWQPRSTTISYGHDIEAAWLLAGAAAVLDDPALHKAIGALSLRIAAAATQGLNPDGSMNYEYEPRSGHLTGERHWWVQAEAIVGFLHAWQVSGGEDYLRHAIRTWDYTRTAILDHPHGEWFWGRNADGSLMAGQDKAGFWKCPYHNSRACIEAIIRLSDPSLPGQ